MVERNKMRRIVTRRNLVIGLGLVAAGGGVPIALSALVDNRKPSSQSDQPTIPTPTLGEIHPVESLPKPAETIPTAALPIASPEQKSERTPAPAAEKTEVPKDVLSKEDLKTANIEIIGTPDTDLLVRKKALENEPVFLWAQKKDDVTKQLTEQFEKSGNLDNPLIAAPRKVKIFLVDGPVVHPKFFTAEQRNNISPAMLNYFEQDFAGKELLARRYFEQHKEEALRNYHQRMQEISTFPEDIKKDAKANYDDIFYPFLNEPREEDLFSQMKHATGQFFVPDNGDSGDRTASIFVAVNGKGMKSSPYGFAEVKGGTNPLESKQSYPKPEDLFTTNDPEYPLADSLYRVYWTLLHELRHFNLSLEEGHLSNHPKPDHEAKDYLTRASEAMSRGDDSFYYFVFVKRKPNGTREVIITKRSISEPKEQDEA